MGTGVKSDSFFCFTLKVNITALKLARKMKSLLFKGIKELVLLMD